MPRKSSDKVDKNDKEMFNTVAKIGWISVKQAGDNFGVKEYRLKQFVKNNLLEAKSDKKTGDVYYRLHADVKKSKAQLRRLCGVTKVYSARTINHDKAIGEKYFELRQKGVLVDFKSESELQKIFNDKLDKLEKNNASIKIGDDQYFADELKDMYKNHFISAPDCYYTIQQEDGSTYSTCYEIVTSSYDQNKIDAKFSFCQLLNMNITCSEI